jgi:hypothetical protein
VRRGSSRRRSGGSAHLCVDDTICYRTLENDDIAEGAPGANSHGFHIEQAGFAKWSTVVWDGTFARSNGPRTRPRCTASCSTYPAGVRVRVGLEKTQPGVTTHREVTKAFGGTHSDPGPFWPRRRFMRLVREFHAELMT